MDNSQEVAPKERRRRKRTKKVVQQETVNIGTNSSERSTNGKSSTCALPDEEKLRNERIPPLLIAPPSTYGQSENRSVTLLKKKKKKGKKPVENEPLSCNETVLDLIVKWIRPEDRFNCLQVCRMWYIKFCQKYEKIDTFCIGSEYLTTEKCINGVCQTMTKSIRRYFNFEFYGLNLGKIRHYDFWLLCAPNILSMKLFECTVRTTGMAKILKHCTQLQTLEIHYRDLKHYRHNFVFKVPSKSIPQTLKSESLRTLKISFDTNWRDRLSFWLHMLEFLLDRFPKLSNFSFCQHNVHFYGQHMGPSRKLGYFLNRAYSTWTEAGARSKFYNYFSSDQMENITLKFLIYDPFLYKALVDVENLNKVTEIAIDWDQEMDQELLMTFAQKQVHLQKVTCVTRRWIGKPALNNSLQQILTLPCLRELELFLYKSYLEWTRDWSYWFMCSNVECLRIVSSDIEFANDCNRPNLRNTKLTSFAVRVKKSEPAGIKNITLFLKTVPELKDLCISHVGIDDLTWIAKNLRKLRSFRMGNTTVGHYYPDGAMNPLKHLRRLEVPNTLPLQNTHFDDLKILRIVHIPYVGREPADNRKTTSLRKRCFTEKDFSTCRSLCSSFETIWIDYFKLGTFEAQRQATSQLSSRELTDWFVNEILLGFLTRLKNLKLLYFEYEGTATKDVHIELSEADVCKIFEKCSSLRIFVCGVIYFRDVLTKQICRYVKPSVSSRQMFSSSRRELLRRYLNVKEDFEIQFGWLKLL